MPKSFGSVLDTASRNPACYVLCAIAFVGFAAYFLRSEPRRDRFLPLIAHRIQSMFGRQPLFLELSRWMVEVVRLTEEGERTVLRVRIAMPSGEPEYLVVYWDEDPRKQLKSTYLLDRAGMRELLRDVSRYLREHRKAA